MTFEFHPQARPDVETHALPDGSCLLFDPVSSEGLALNLVGALVWEYCDGALTNDEIADEIAALTPEHAGLRDEVLMFLKEFTRNGLLLPAVIFPPDATGVTGATGDGPGSAPSQG